MAIVKPKQQFTKISYKKYNALRCHLIQCGNAKAARFSGPAWVQALLRPWKY
jgi:hypothetical protein